MSDKMTEVWKILTDHSSKLIKSSRSGTNGKPLTILNLEAHDKIIEYIGMVKINERIKYALELRDMDSHTAMGNICDTALKGN